MRTQQGYTMSDTKGGEAVKTLINFNKDLLEQLDGKLIPLVRESGKKFNRSQIVRSLIEIAIDAMTDIDVDQIRDETTLTKELRKAIIEHG